MDSLRLTFSVSDLRNDVEEDYDENAENESENDGEEAPQEEDTMVSYPINAALTITKACIMTLLSFAEANTLRLSGFRPGSSRT